MPLQNRLDPFGNLIRTAARGTMMGNRGGALHNADREIIRAYKSRRWITCVLEFRGRHRSVMSPNRYTELFFLDEATAFASGHRPCAECRRAKYNEYCNCFDVSMIPAVSSIADSIDDQLHTERLTNDRRKRTYSAALDELPNAVFVTIPKRGDQAYLVLGKHLL